MNHHRYIHFSEGDPSSWAQNDYEIAIWVDFRQAMQEEVLFYRSTKGVIISPGINETIDKKYLLKIVDPRTQKVLPAVDAQGC